MSGHKKSASWVYPEWREKETAKSVLTMARYTAWIKITWQAKLAIYNLHINKSTIYSINYRSSTNKINLHYFGPFNFGNFVVVVEMWNVD